MTKSFDESGTAEHLGPITAFHYKHVVVVHGIGDQAPNETVLGFMNEFVRALPRQAGRYSVELYNLIETVDDVSLTGPRAASKPARSFQPAYLTFTDERKGEQHVIGFSEVYWQHIPKRYLDANDGRLPIPIFTWARSINARLLRPQKAFRLASQAIDNLERLLKLTKTLASMYAKSEQFYRITTQFLGDVEMYTESDVIRTEINNRFLDVMARVPHFIDELQVKIATERGRASEFQSREIYLVAHSEGTVVTFNSIVEAVGKRQPLDWLPLVRGLVTLGSPLDKHYTIWQHRFRNRTLSQPGRLATKIAWFNYWDRNDPVGYGLRVLFPGDATSPTDAERLFELRFDRGFARYLIPGLAHVGYWRDYRLLEHVIDRVMGLGTTRKDTTPGDRWWAPFHWPMVWSAHVFVRALIIVVGVFLLRNLSAPFLGDAWSIKDELGYLSGLVVLVLIWRLHTCIHRGLLQMWRYTMRSETAVTLSSDSARVSTGPEADTHADHS